MCLEYMKEMFGFNVTWHSYFLIHWQSFLREQSKIVEEIFSAALEMEFIRVYWNIRHMFWLILSRVKQKKTLLGHFNLPSYRKDKKIGIVRKLFQMFSEVFISKFLSWSIWRKKGTLSIRSSTRTGPFHLVICKVLRIQKMVMQVSNSIFACCFYFRSHFYNYLWIGALFWNVSWYFYKSLKYLTSL